MNGTAETRLERLAAVIVPELEDLSIDGRAEWLRRHLTSEIAKRRSNGRGAWSASRMPESPAWDAWQRAWIESLPSEELDEFVGALALLR